MNMQVVKCPNCNGEIQIDVSREYGFCSYCGTKIVFSQDCPVNATKVFESNRESALNKLQSIIDHFQSISATFVALDKLNSDIPRMKKANHNTSMAVGLLSVLVGICIFERFSHYSIMFILIGLAFVAYSFWADWKRKKRIEDAEIEVYTLNQQINRKYNEYSSCPIGVEYCHPRILNTLYDYIRQGRSETIKEAINLMSTEIHNDEMKQIAKETKNIAQQQLNVSQQQLKVAKQNLNVNKLNMYNNILKK